MAFSKFMVNLVYMKPADAVKYMKAQEDIYINARTTKEEVKQQNVHWRPVPGSPVRGIAHEARRRGKYDGSAG